MRIVEPTLKAKWGTGSNEQGLTGEGGGGYEGGAGGASGGGSGGGGCEGGAGGVSGGIDGGGCEGGAGGSDGSGGAPMDASRTRESMAREGLSVLPCTELGDHVADRIGPC